MFVSEDHCFESVFCTDYSEIMQCIFTEVSESFESVFCTDYSEIMQCTFAESFASPSSTLSARFV